MEKTVTVIFDGQVLHPEMPLNLEPHKRYTIIITEDVSVAAEEDVWNLLDDLVGTIEAPQDWASEHDHYLYGTPKH